MPTPVVKCDPEVSPTKSKSSPKKKSKGATKDGSKSPEAKLLKLQKLQLDKKASPSKLALGLVGTDSAPILDDGGFKSAAKREGRTMLIYRLIEEFRVEYDAQSPRASPILTTRTTADFDHEIMEDLLSPYARIGERFPPFVCLVPRVDLQRAVSACADLADAEQCLSPEPRLKQRALRAEKLEEGER